MKKEQYEAHAALGLDHWWHFGTKMFFRQLLLRSVPRGASVLDAGCGVGDMLHLLRDEYRVVGVDASETAVTYCRSRGLGDSVAHGNILALPFGDGTFDAVLSLDVLYHQWVPDDLQSLKELRRVLKPGGKLLIQVPAYEWIKSGHDIGAMTARRYTAPLLLELLRAAGFSTARTAYRMTALFPFVALKRIIRNKEGSDMKSTSPRFNALLKCIIRVENVVARTIRLPFGLSVFGVGTK